MTDTDIDVLGRETLYEGFIKLTRYRLRHRLHEGGWSGELIRERVEGLRAASVLLFDPDLDVVVLVEQFRIGALDGEQGAWVLETVGGYVPPGERPEAVARREVREETGCEVRELERICEFYVSPGFSTERIDLFCGRIDAANAGGVHGLPEEGEDILVRVLPAADAIKAAGTPPFDSTSLIIALQWLAINGQRLRERWPR
jgi:ADP-ribose pyrophosphatase